MAQSHTELPIRVDLEIWGGHGIGTVVELFHSRRTTPEYVNSDNDLSDIEPYFSGAEIGYEPPYISHFPAPHPFLEVTLEFGLNSDVRVVSSWLQRHLKSVGVQKVHIQDPRKKSDTDSIIVEVTRAELAYYLAMIVRYEIQVSR